MRSNVVAQYFFNIARGLGRVVCNSLRNLLSDYQQRLVTLSTCR